MTFFFTLLFIILVFWRPQEWLVPWLYGWQVLDAVFFMALLTFLLEVDQGRIRIPKEIPQVYLVGGLWFAAIMSHVAHTYYVGMMDTIVPVFKICFFTLLLFCVLDRPSRLRLVSTTFVVMACLMAIHAIMQQRLGYGFGGRGPLYIPGYGDRLPHTRSFFFGIFEDPNDLAQILATSIPFAFTLSWRRSFAGHVLGCAVTCLLVIAILTTHSRGGLVALVTVVSVMLVLLLPSNWLPVAFIVLVTGGLVMCPLSAGFMDDSAHDRVVFWGTANWVFKENPLFGVGYGMFGEYIEGDRAAHNAFVLCYTELGLFGYWFWFSLLQLGIVGAWRTRIALRRVGSVEQAWLRRFAGLSIASMAGFSASAYFLARAFIYPMFFLFAILGSLPVIARSILPKDNPWFMNAKKDLFVMATLGTLASVLYVYVSIVILNKVHFG